MARTRLADPVYGPDGIITTIAELADKGLVTFSVCHNWHT